MVHARLQARVNAQLDLLALIVTYACLRIFHTRYAASVIRVRPVHLTARAQARERVLATLAIREVTAV